MISFKAIYFPNEIILYAVFLYVRNGVTDRDLEEILAERVLNTLNRWVVDYSPLIAESPKSINVLLLRFWRIDEMVNGTIRHYIRVSRLKRLK